MTASVDFTISFDPADEEGWIVARVLEVPGAISQGRTREEARENVLDALRTVLTPDEELAGETPESDREHLRFGCREIGGSKHAKWRGPENQVSALPRHNEIGPGLVRAICRQLGVPAPPNSR
jgi:predicted RNase H-like HicB family nuclease